jgi:hypothetical protein
MWATPVKICKGVRSEVSIEQDNGCNHVTSSFAKSTSDCKSRSAEISDPVCDPRDVISFSVTDTSIYPQTWKTDHTVIG